MTSSNVSPITSSWALGWVKVQPSCWTVDVVDMARGTALIMSPAVITLNETGAIPWMDFKCIVYSRAVVVVDVRDVWFPVWFCLDPNSYKFEGTLN